MPTHLTNCPVCGVEHLSAPRRSESFSAAGGETCPYKGLAYAEVRAGHDHLYFGRWRRMDATRIDIRQARHRLERHLRAIAAVIRTEDVPAARRDLEKAFEAFYTAGPEEEDREDLLFLDHALSYAHRVIGDLLHEKGLPPHSPADFAGWYDSGEIPFREDW